MKPYELRVDEALNEMLASRNWSGPQAKWLERIASQMKKEIIVDKDAMNKAAFREMGASTALTRPSTDNWRRSSET